MKVLAVAGNLFVPLILWGLIGIIPGLLLGILGWHRPAGAILALLFAFGYIKQRGKSYGDVNWVSYAIGIGGGLGLVVSVWFFGTITD